MANLSNDVKIISGDNEEIQTNKYLLSLFSPSLHSLLSTPCCTYAYQTIILPDCSTYSIRNLINLITNGFSWIDERGTHVLLVAELLSIEISMLTKEKYNSKQKSNKKETTNKNSKISPVCKTLNNEKLNQENSVKKDKNVEHTSKDKKSIRKGTFSCEQCEYKTKRKYRLKEHVQYIHEGNFYTCEQCDYIAAQKSQIKLHVEIKHEGIRYSCDQCDFKGQTKTILKQHVQYLHEGRVYPCSQCKYEARIRGELNQHIKIKHSQ